MDTSSEQNTNVLKDDDVVIPANMKLRLEKCPKCMYERKPEDDDLSSPFECPKCGVVYALAMEEVRRQNRGQELQDEAEAEAMRRLSQQQDENIRSSQIGSAMFVGQQGSMTWIIVAAIVACLGAAVFFLL